MKIIANAEFVYLTEKQSPRLQSVAKERYARDPNGFLEEVDVSEYKKIFAYSGDKSAVRWLDNLLIFTKNGTVSRIKSGRTTWEDHVQDVGRRVAKGELPFDLGQHVQCKESGRYGSVVDYIPDSEEYLVVLNPFQVMTYKKGDLKRVAQLDLDDESLKFPGQYLLSITYEIVTEESAAEGDVAERGFEEENLTYGSLDELADDLTHGNHAHSWLEWSGSPAQGGDWIVGEANQDYRTGEWISYSAHMSHADGSPLSNEETKFVGEKIGLKTGL